MTRGLSPLRRYYAMRAVGSMANTILQFAVPILVYQTTRSVGWSGAGLAVEWIPRIVSLPLAGVLVDRFRIRRVYVLSDVVRGGAAVLVAGVAVLAPERAQLAALVLLALVAGACYEQTFVAGEKVVRLLAAGDGMERAQAALGSIDQACDLAGPAAGGLLLLVGSTATVALIIGSLFCLSLGLAWRLKVTGEDDAPGEAPAVNPEAQPLTLGGIARELRVNGRKTLGHPVLRTVVAVTFCTNLLVGLVMAGAPALVERNYGAPASSLGAVYTTAGLASIACLAGTPRLMRRFGMFYVGAASALATCVAFTALAAVAHVAVFGSLVVLMFSAQSIFTVFIRVVRARILAANEFAGVVSVILVLNFAALPLAGLLLAVSPLLLPLRQMVLATGGAVVLGATALLLRLSRLMPQHRGGDGSWVIPALQAGGGGLVPATQGGAGEETR